MESSVINKRVYTKVELDLLDTIRLGCFCESYYKYKCYLCFSLYTPKNKTIIAKLFNLGLIEPDSYQGYRITQEGRFLLKEEKENGQG